VPSPGKQGNPLSWPERQHIARGAAEGIAYLHTDCTPKLIHRDIKASAAPSLGALAVREWVGVLAHGLPALQGCVELIATHW